MSLGSQYGHQLLQSVDQVRNQPLKAPTQARALRDWINMAF